MKDFSKQEKAKLDNHNIDSYSSSSAAYIETQRFFRHWFGVLIVLINGEWEMMTDQGNRIFPPENTMFTIHSLLQWCLENRGDYENPRAK